MPHLHDRLDSSTSSHFVRVRIAPALQAKRTRPAGRHARARNTGPQRACRTIAQRRPLEEALLVARLALSSVDTLREDNPIAITSISNRGVLARLMAEYSLASAFL